MVEQPENVPTVPLLWKQEQPRRP